MQALCYMLLLLLVLAASAFRKLDPQKPRLKPGRADHSSHVSRTWGKGRLRMGLSLTSTENVVLDLEPNDDVLSSDYQEMEVSPSGVVARTHRHKSDITGCWFRGHIVGEANSHVLVSDCDGVEGLIQRADGTNWLAYAKGTRDVGVYALEDEEEERGSCGVSHGTATARAHEELHAAPSLGRRLLTVNNSANVIEVAVVSDFSYLQARGGDYGRNLSQVANLNVQIMALVQATYTATAFAKPTSLRVKAQYFFATGDPYSITPNGDGEVDENTLLTSFTTWSQGLGNSVDHVLLLTYYDLLGFTIGFANTASACSNSKTAVSEAANTVLRVANTVSHELGHVLGMMHDPGTVPCPNEGYVMATIESCPSTGLCAFSPCSISDKDTFTSNPSASCLYTYTDPTCSDGVWNGDELGVDCGGSCPACTNLTGCLVNNGGCEQTCTPAGVTSFVCSCNATMYLNPVDGKSCVADIDQCATSSPCQGTCTNLLGPGGVFTSFICSCPSPLVLSVVDGVSCAPASCFDRVKNQDEVLTDCGGICSRSCDCLISTANWHFSYDRGVSVAGGQWRTKWDNPAVYELTLHGIPLRYLYKNSGTWYYDDDLSSASNCFGYKSSAVLSPPSGTWTIYTGASFSSQQLSFANCSSTPSTCGDGVVDGGEVCDSCALFIGGTCIKQNPCCDSTCLASKLRGLSCKDKNELPGSCWDGDCITRAAACEVITASTCFGSSYSTCANGTGGQECGVRADVFSSNSCNAPFVCYLKCEPTSLSGFNTPIGAVRGYPCSTADSSGMYPLVCDGGINANGMGGSSCVTVSSLDNYLTQSPSHSPTTRTPTTLMPTRSPVTISPTTISPSTLSPTSRSPSSMSPTKQPTTSSPTGPTMSPTTSQPTTASPTLQPTTGIPTVSPTSRSPSSVSPTRAPSTGLPTTLYPTSSPTAPGSNATATASGNFLGIEGLPEEYKYFYYGGAALVLVVLIVLVAVCCKRSTRKRGEQRSPRRRHSGHDVELDG